MGEGKPRGFAAISPERRKEIASMGGKAAHEQGRAHQWDSEGAKAAGMKGGAARRKVVNPAPEPPQDNG